MKFTVLLFSLWQTKLNIRFKLVKVNIVFVTSSGLLRNECFWYFDVYLFLVLH